MIDGAPGAGEEALEMRKSFVTVRSYLQRRATDRRGLYCRTLGGTADAQLDMTDVEFVIAGGSWLPAWQLGLRNGDVFYDKPGTQTGMSSPTPRRY